MELTFPKLPLEVAPRLKECPVSTVAPYVLMMAPMYVFMPKNQRFVSVKAPLDFFTPQELERLSSVGSFYVPDFVEHVIPYRSAGKSIRSLLGYLTDDQTLGLTPFELSDAILQLTAPLWKKDLSVDPYFITILVNELFDPFPEKILNKARDESVERFERSLYQSSWAAFLALHAGYTDLKDLQLMRNLVFQYSCLDRPVPAIKAEWDEIIVIAQKMIPTAEVQRLTAAQISDGPETIRRRIEGRLKRVKEHLNIVPFDFIAFAEMLKEEIKVRPEDIVANAETENKETDEPTEAA